jgi:hypothetical protein
MFWVSYAVDNERLTAGGEFWRLDAETRPILGLPPARIHRKDRAARH